MAVYHTRLHRLYNVQPRQNGTKDGKLFLTIDSGQSPIECHKTPKFFQLRRICSLERNCEHLHLSPRLLCQHWYRMIFAWKAISLWSGKYSQQRVRASLIPSDYGWTGKPSIKLWLMHPVDPPIITPNVIQWWTPAPVTVTSKRHSKYFGTLPSFLSNEPSQLDGQLYRIN